MLYLVLAVTAVCIGIYLAVKHEEEALLRQQQAVRK
jgi:hypothetical protein